MSTPSNNAAMSPWALENGHKIARLLQYHEGPPYNIPAILDQALAPVRECLEGLRDGGCWCGVTPASNDEIVPAIYQDHSDACLAAQQLWERLKIQ